MLRWIQGFTLAGTALGAAVVFYGVARFAGEGAISPLLVSLALVIVGPGEDILKGWARRRGRTQKEQEEWALFVDRATSVAFLALLAFAIHLWP